MIKSFRNRQTAAVYLGERPKGLPPDILKSAFRKLVQLDAATQIDDLRAPPGNRLEQLKGDRAGQWSIRINGQWRICFNWIDSNAENVEIVDYHR
ncbi:MAG: type II toxin-antitoxin system RelE/ParE family toxin [Beijerinckiaceae bacterium]